MLTSLTSSSSAARRCGAVAGLLAATTGVLLTGAAWAQELRGPITKEIVFEKRYQFFARGYREPVLFEPGATEPVPPPTTASADEMAIYVLGLQAAGDVEGWLAWWSPEDADRWRRKFDESGNTPRQVAERWRRAWSDRRAQLTGHLYRGREEIIQYAVLDGAGGQPERRDALVFRHAADGRWQLVDLTGDAVLELGDFDGAERIVERPWKRGE